MDPSEEVLGEEVPLDGAPQEVEHEHQEQLDGRGLQQEQEGEDSTRPSSSAVEIKTVPWLRQLSTILWYKNLPLLQRRPILLFLMIFSSVGSVLLAWPAGKDYDDNVVWPPLNECGVVELDYLEGLEYEERAKVPLSLNDSWRRGLPVTIMALGPMIAAICTFLVVHSELELQMLGVLRGSGLLDSVYWVGWYVPFTIIASINSLLGAFTAALLPVHVFQATYFAGVFGSLFFLQLALIGSSLFLAAVLGKRRRGSVWLILIIICALWVPLLMIFFTSPFSVSADTLAQSSGITTPVGLFWLNYQTSSRSYTYDQETGNETLEECNFPILSETEGTLLKTESEREAVGPDSFFLGCYFLADWGTSLWSATGKGKIGLAVMWLFPYFHFNAIWGNFAGFTAYNGTEFRASHAVLTAGELAREAFPPPSEDESENTTLFPQGNMLQVQVYYEYECEVGGEYSCEKYKSNCPSQDLEGFNFCELYSQCQYAKEQSPAEGKSVHQMFGMLVALSLVYLVMAIYWGIVLVGGPGTHPFYFIFQKSYWFGATKKNDSHNSGQTDTETGATGVEVAVNVEGLHKHYGSMEAVSNVSLQMAKGEVTALLGHNGAGKTTLVNVLTCEVRATSGDITVFGNSVSDDSNKISQLVGICKQDDYLYPTLTANEHLSLFAGLRGVDPEVLDEIVQKWLESVDLNLVQHQYSQEFSGGMKRRLSLALSTIGGRPLIVLDEPTTGMDPVSRRYVWKHIDAIKQDRVVLLTTHAMEEADLLADMVAIMRKGKLAAWGTPLELKAEYASALQFNLLVEKENIGKATAGIRGHFEGGMDWVKISAGDAGNITVTILNVQESPGQQGVPVDVLTNFVGWLDDPESGIKEYGFANSSLEEVFLRVTEGDVEEIQTNLPGDAMTVSEAESQPSEDVSQRVKAFTPNLKVDRQCMALVWQSIVLSWTGRRSVGTWLIYGMFVFISTILGIQFAAVSDKIPALALQVGFLSFILMNICSAIYDDRSEGLFYLMRTQGLLKTSYLLGTCLYAWIVATVYACLMLTLLYATPMIRDPSVCTENWEANLYCDSIQFGERPIITQSEMVEIPYVGELDGQPVSVFAYLTPGNLGKFLGAGFVFAITMPGAALASSYLPGYKFALVMIAFLSIGATITPVVIYFRSTAVSNPQKLKDCFDVELCGSVFATGEVNEAYLDCVGFLQGNPSSLCIPPYAGILPQFGLFQMLSMSMMSRVTFYSSSPGFVENTFVPNIEASGCSGNSCTFPFANKLYGQNAGWELLGALSLLFVGICLAHIFTFPPSFVLEVKIRMAHLIELIRCKYNRMRHQTSEGNKEELEEVGQEREVVETIVRPILSSSASETVLVDHAKIARDDISPIIMYKLRKVFPSLGRLPPKVALKSLDLHVPKGQVLGFLGKNGAGKTTALKILAGALDATSGIGLVSGYDVGSERIEVFEHLGNCPQFDIVWKEMTVKEHLVFFAKLKGLPRKEVQAAAFNIAAAVGLGATEVYNRNAQALSGGMRRRLSIAISLIGAPNVLLCDEPSTGLDPSTRNNIWNLVNSFATDERAIVITTHMMLEADTLCNRIAIISRGELVVCASQQHLKDRFGSGYLLQLNLAKSTQENQEEAMAFAQKHLHKDATLQTKQAKTLHVNLPRDLDLKEAFAALYNPQVRPPSINQFLLSQSSLEDVFIALGDD